eukprot:9488751-Alexandrium_andersonii.AAC.1
MCGTRCGAALPPLAAFRSSFLRTPPCSHGGSRLPGPTQKVPPARAGSAFLGGSGGAEAPP